MPMLRALSLLLVFPIALHAQQPGGRAGDPESGELTRVQGEIRIELLARAEADGGRLPNDVSKALEALTGEVLGRTAGPWRMWWADHKEGWKPPTEAAKAPPKQEGDAGGTVAFYGLKVVSKRIAFVLDISGSMDKPAHAKGGVISSGGSAGTPPGAPPLPQNPTKLDVAKHELIKSLRGLKKDVYFDMVFYSDDVQVWQEELVLATPENIERAVGEADVTFMEKLATQNSGKSAHFE